MSVRNLEYLRSLASKEYPDLGAKLYEALHDLEQQQSNIAQQVNGNPSGQPTPPAAIQGLKVSGKDGHFQLAIQDESQVYRDVHYYVEHADNPQFTNPHVVHLGHSRNHSLFLGNAKRYFRAYSAYSSSKPSPAVYHGTPAEPLAVEGGGSVPAPDFLSSQGSGTGAPGQGLSGPGPVPFRSASGAAPVRGEQSQQAGSSRVPAITAAAAGLPSPSAAGAVSRGGASGGGTGAPGPAGAAATVEVGTTTTGEPGTDAAVTNSGTSSAAVLNFAIPRGEKGDKGDPGTGGGTPGDTVAALDGTGAAGTSTDYSRKDHKHADAARHTHANKTTLDLVEEAYTTAEKTKLGALPDAATLAGELAAKADASDLAGYVPTTRTVNGHALSADVTVSKADVGLGNVTNDAQLKAADLDTDGTLAADSDAKIPSQKAVKTYVDAHAGGSGNHGISAEFGNPQVGSITYTTITNAFTAGEVTLTVIGDGSVTVKICRTAKNAGPPTIANVLNTDGFSSTGGETHITGAGLDDLSSKDFALGDNVAVAVTAVTGTVTYLQAAMRSA